MHYKKLNETEVQNIKTFYKIIIYRATASNIVFEKILFLMLAIDNSISLLLPIACFKVNFNTFL